MRAKTIESIIQAIKISGSFSRMSTVENIAYDANVSVSSVRRAIKLKLVATREDMVEAWESKKRGQNKGRTYTRIILGLNQPVI